MTFLKKNKKIIDVVFWVILGVILFWKFIFPRIAFSVDFQDVTFKDETGVIYNVSDFKDKNVMINFYQSWCGPCMAEMPALERAYKQLEEEDFIYIAVSDEPFHLINKVKQRVNGQLIFLQSEKSLKEVGIYSYPTSYLLNKNKQLVYKKAGVENWDSPDVLNEFRKLVKYKN